MTSFDLVLGSYERMIYGLRFCTDENGERNLEPTFRYPAHLSCIKCIAGYRPGKKGHAVLATGGADEQIRLYDLSSKKEKGNMANEHEGSITAMQMNGRGDLVTVAEDGKLATWICKDGQLIESFKGHKGKIMTLLLHPNHKRIAYTTTSDRQLGVWDLGALSTPSRIKIPIIPECGAISDSYLIYGHHKGLLRLDLDGSNPTEITLGARVHAVQVYKEEFVIAGCEDGTIRIVLLKDEMNIKAEFEAHTTRIKLLCIFDDFAVSGASDGNIHMYNIAEWLEALESGDTAPPQPLVTHKTGLRLTCGIAL